MKRQIEEELQLGWMNQFIAGFFLVFSAFKLLNLKGFTEGYTTPSYN